MAKAWDDCGGLAPIPLSLPKAMESAEAFKADVALVCRQLGSTRLRCSLFGIRPLGIETPDALMRLAARFERLGIVGLLRKGHIGFMHLDRCVVPERDDARIAAMIRGQAIDALAPGTMRRFVALHYWTDEVASADELIWRLEDRAFRHPFPTVEPYAAVSAA
jgi:hypothetical protein